MLLKRSIYLQVEQCFSLSQTAYAISYKDDDGEVTEINRDSELAEAIKFFQQGSEDTSHSSAASIISGRSFGSRKITLRVQVTVDYDGPSLSDSSSLASLDEYQGRNGSQISFSFSAQPQGELDDDSLTVSSRDAGLGSYPTDVTNYAHDISPTSHSQSIISQAGGTSSVVSSSLREYMSSSNTDPFADPQVTNRASGLSLSRENMRRATSEMSDEYHFSAASRYPEDPAELLEHLRLQDDAVSEDQIPTTDYDDIPGDDRAKAWLRDQNERHIRSKLGALPEPSISDGTSVSHKHETDPGQLASRGLALRQNQRGKWYYAYESAAGSSATSQTPESGYEAGSNAGEAYRESGPRPSSMNLNWLAAQQISAWDERDLNQRHNTALNTHHPDLLPLSREYPHPEIPPEVLQYIPVRPPNSDQLTDCSHCGRLLDSIRYVCTTCGEKTPLQRRGLDKGKGKGKYFATEVDSTSYPLRPRHCGSDPEISSQTDTNGFGITHNIGPYTQKPLPALPTGCNYLSQTTLVGSSHHLALDGRFGYELCASCIEHTGIAHAIEAAGLASTSPGRGSSVPSSPEDVSQWTRSAPRKGQLRHCYLEKSWGHRGWEDVGK